MIRKIFFILLAVSAPLVFAVTVQNTISQGRSVGGNVVSDVDVDPEVPVFGNIFDPILSDTNNATILWSQVTTDSNGDPITLINYEVRYRIVGAVEYSVILVPAAFSGLSTVFSVGSYEGYIEAVASNGWVSPASAFTFEVN